MEYRFEVRLEVTCREQMLALDTGETVTGRTYAGSHDGPLGFERSARHDGRELVVYSGQDEALR